jgi:hypothetical protein
MRRRGREYDTVAPAPTRRTERIVTAFFDAPDEAHRAYLALQHAGFGPDEITVAANETTAPRDLALTEHTKAPEGGLAGAAVGGGVGALVGALSIAGAVLLPGFGWVAGPLLGALAGAGLGGTAGGVVGAFVGAGMPEHEARVIEDAVRRGGVVLAVHARPGQEARVREILKSHNGRSVSVS